MKRVGRRAFLTAMAGTLLPSPWIAYAAQVAEAVKIRNLWGDHGAFSDVAQSLNGKAVEMRGYMAPPLKPEIDFFVLTRIPMGVCPFCDTEASWPDDLVVVYIDQALQPVSFNDLITVTGQLELGTKTDEGTGFVSRIRLVQSRFTRV